MSRKVNNFNDPTFKKAMEDYLAMRIRHKSIGKGYYSPIEMSQLIKQYYNSEASRRYSRTYSDPYFGSFKKPKVSVNSYIRNPSHNPPYSRTYTSDRITESVPSPVRTRTVEPKVKPDPVPETPVDETPKSRFQIIAQNIKKSEDIDAQL